MSSTHDNAAQDAGRSVATTTFTVADMSCNHCVESIRKSIEQTMPGVPLSIDLDRREVTVAGDAARASEAIRAAGYEPRPLAR